MSSFPRFPHLCVLSLSNLRSPRSLRPSFCPTPAATSSSSEGWRGAGVRRRRRRARERERVREGKGDVCSSPVRLAAHILVRAVVSAPRSRIRVVVLGRQVAGSSSAFFARCVRARQPLVRVWEEKKNGTMKRNKMKRKRRVFRSGGTVAAVSLLVHLLFGRVYS